MADTDEEGARLCADALLKIGEEQGWSMASRLRHEGLNTNDHALIMIKRPEGDQHKYACGLGVTYVTY